MRGIPEDSKIAGRPGRGRGREEGGGRRGGVVLLDFHWWLVWQ